MAFYLPVLADRSREIFAKPPHLPASSGQVLGPLTTDERTELARLRKELKRVEMERDFLKIASAFFARDT